jgi:exopolysaccharide production protein ExoZ
MPATSAGMTNSLEALPLARFARPTGNDISMRCMSHISVARPKLVAVQVLRALAALMVAMHHAQYDAAAVAARAGQPFTYSKLLPWTAGVDIFFVISGFIMVYASADLFGRRDGPRRFLERRIARIVPLYWAVTTVFLAIAFLAPAAINSAAPNLWQVIASYLFVPTVGADGHVQPVYTLGWTLNYEMFFYVLFAFAIVLQRAYAVVAVTAMLMLFVVARPFVAPLSPTLAFWGDPIVLEFVFGMVLGLMRTRGAGLPLAVRLVLGAIGLAVLHLDLVRPDAPVSLPAIAAYGIPAALLVAAAAFHRDSETPWRFERPLAALGDASYALYLVHPFAIRVLRELVLFLGAGALMGPWAFVGIALVLAVVAALAVYMLFERPTTQALRSAMGAERLKARYTE